MKCLFDLAGGHVPAERGGVREAPEARDWPGANGSCREAGQGAVGLRQHVHACLRSK